MTPDARPLSAADQARIDTLHADVHRLSAENAAVLDAVHGLRQQLALQAQDREADQELKSAVFTTAKWVQEAVQVADSEPGRALYLTRLCSPLLEDPATERRLAALQEKAFLEQVRQRCATLEHNLVSYLGASALEKIERLISTEEAFGALREYDAVKRAADRVGFLSSSNEGSANLPTIVAIVFAGFWIVGLIAASDSNLLFSLALLAYISAIVAAVVRRRRSKATRTAVIADLAAIGWSLPAIDNTDGWLLETAQQRRQALLSSGFNDQQLGPERASLLRSLGMEYEQLLSWMRSAR